MTPDPSFVCDSSWHRYSDGTTLVAGSPLAVFSLSEAGRDVARALESGEPLPEFHRPLTSRLASAGAIHPLASPLEESLESLLTVVIPAHVSDDAGIARLRRLVEELSVRCSVIVVDDASPQEVVVSGAARVIRLDANRGPGAARNSGLEAVTTPFVAFVDSDVTECGSALPLLVATCSLDGVGLAAPRVASRPGVTRIARYEERFSPLDLGSEPGRVAPGSRISYVPSAMWVVRTEVAKSLGGFDAEMRVGEDVDFVWRLTRAGSMARYEPRAIVHHEPRPTLRALIRQRFSYGRSVGPLSVRHPSLLRPLKTSWHSLVLWVFFFAGLAPISALLGIYTFVGLARRLRHLDHGVREAFRLVVRGHWSALSSIVRALRREWIPFTLLCFVAGGYLGGLAIAVFIIPSVASYLRGPKRLDPITFVVLRILDDASYGMGAVAACVRTRTIRPVVPDLRTWRANVH
ncbi:MAG: mycofactocin system glycosyltransferase [Actinomycetota bacterium]